MMAAGAFLKHRFRPLEAADYWCRYLVNDGGMGWTSASIIEICEMQIHSITASVGSVQH